MHKDKASSLSLKRRRAHGLQSTRSNCPAKDSPSLNCSQYVKCWRSIISMAAFHDSCAETTHLRIAHRLWVSMLACAAVWLGCVMLPDRLVAEIGHAPASDVSLQQD